MTLKSPQSVSAGSSELPSPASLPSPRRRRIPAWERFGLKLKKNVASVNVAYAADDAVRKRKEADRIGDEKVNGKSQEEEDAPPAKKRQQKVPPLQATEEASSFLPSEPAHQLASAQAPISADNMSTAATTTAAATTPAKNVGSTLKKQRKGVTFTPDTKQTDGHSAQLFMRGNPSGQSPIVLPWHDVDWPAADEEDFVGEVSTEPGDAPPEPMLRRKEKKEKKEKRKKNKQANGEVDRNGNSATDTGLAGHSRADTLSNTPHVEPRSSTPPLHAALQYLDQYQRLRPQWKFNKARQSYLLKHLLDFGRIPARWDGALCLYITGLQGEGVRARVRAAMEEGIAASAIVDAPPAPGDKASPAYLAWLDKVQAAVQHAHEQPRHKQPTTAGCDAAPNASESGLRDGVDGEANDDSAALKDLDVVARAEAILRALCAAEEGSVMTAASNTEKPAVARGIEQHGGRQQQQQQQQNGVSSVRQLSRRKRKLRTNAVELSSSEDDAASNSSSSNDSDSGSAVSSGSGGESASSGRSSTSVGSEGTTSSNNTTLGSGSDGSGEDNSGSDAEDSNTAVEGSSESSDGSTAIDPSTDGDDDSSTAIDASSDGSDGGDEDDDDGVGDDSDDDATIAIRKDGSSGGSSDGSSDSDSSDGNNDSSADAQACGRGFGADSNSDSDTGSSPGANARFSVFESGNRGSKKGRRMKSHL